MEIIPSGKSSPGPSSPGVGSAHTQTTPEPPSPACLAFCLTTQDRQLRMGWTTWWSSRGARTRSHPELGRENPQRPWYCVLRHGRVGRRQVFQPIHHPGRNNRAKPPPPGAKPGDRRQGAHNQGERHRGQGPATTQHKTRRRRNRPQHNNNQTRKPGKQAQRAHCYLTRGGAAR